MIEHTVTFQKVSRAIAAWKGKPNLQSSVCHVPPQVLPNLNFNAVSIFHGRSGCRHKPLPSSLLEEKESPAALSNAYHWTISAIPGSPEFVSIRKLQLWVMLKSDAVLQAESWNRTDSGRTGTTWTGRGYFATTAGFVLELGIGQVNSWTKSPADNNGFVSRVLFSFSRCNAGLLPYYRSIRSVSLLDRPNLAFDGVGYGHGGRWVWWAWWVRWTWWTCPSSQPYLHGLHLKSSTTDGWEGGRRAGGPIARTLYRRRKRSIVPPTIPHPHTDDAAKGPSRLLSNITLRWGSDQTLEGWRTDLGGRQRVEGTG
ncbi:hypothetical protein V495_07024 [Pseudogymnoascus sp. VKM F-4514 (FW-929)]|nr:hypothetical protein V495_07024 [Pseudogymnoascus sp. VKM F-4514 (FW-929)]KFY63361.1 hypothetical protein V497_02043 [Pseudogymnoascus sp. VKM F-4516 (FW-969)]